MSRNLMIAGALAAAVCAISLTSAQAQMLSPFQAGYNLGMQRGYGPAQSNCFASVFARRATISASGHWVAAANNSYTDELWNRCRISR
jgi:hypothetical protein